MGACRAGRDSELRLLVPELNGAITGMRPQPRFDSRSLIKWPRK